MPRPQPPRERAGSGHETTPRADPGGGGHGGAHAPSFGTKQARNSFTARLAHVATPTQRTSLYEQLLHVLQT